MGNSAVATPGLEEVLSVGRTSQFIKLSGDLIKVSVCLLIFLFSVFLLTQCLKLVFNDQSIRTEDFC